MENCVASLLIVLVACALGACGGVPMRVDVVQPHARVTLADDTCTAPCELQVYPSRSDIALSIEHNGKQSVVNLAPTQKPDAWATGTEVASTSLCVLLGGSGLIGCAFLVSSLSIIPGVAPLSASIAGMLGAVAFAGLCAWPCFVGNSVINPLRVLPQRVNIDVDKRTVQTFPPTASHFAEAPSEKPRAPDDGTTTIAY